MKSVGVIVEYNPFHNGHLYHLKQSKRIAQAEVVVAVMSGNFLQRGEPAFVHKWSRTNMALKAGADVVIELPYMYAVQKAEFFAQGAVDLLSALQVDALCFGSESGDIHSFTHTYEWMKKHELTIQHTLKKEISLGVSYPEAMARAYKSLPDETNVLPLDKPNNILGYHYVKAALDKKHPIELHTIARSVADYHDEELPAQESIASATSIRKSIISGELASIQHYMPQSSYEELQHYLQSEGTFHTWENYYSLLRYRILTSSVEELRDIYECVEGLEYRLKKAASSALTFESFIEQLKTKRYTRTRLQRMLSHILLNVKKRDMDELLAPDSPPYLRILGMSQTGRTFLHQRKKKLTVPLLTKATGGASDNHPALVLDELAATVHQSVLSSPTPEYKRRIIIRD
ncbi:nucleotidyltransferase [Paenalkalicoccus suaedae]|uniref:tRNA(Met) cytidine acetate ligase n=1 Tax=Paenalkalicoccus suaedae TaxID=2592382 RepID=A0A859FED1_9BACI|nr:nucleotidyltransferase [Paenalkalicoccus suaedae]QKS71539.1 nucleotidyltransferase [Paenalkalicoccus suaedae]